jgi:hypothetical protein
LGVCRQGHDRPHAGVACHINVVRVSIPVAILFQIAKLRTFSCA